MADGAQRHIDYYADTCDVGCTPRPKRTGTRHVFIQRESKVIEKIADRYSASINSPVSEIHDPNSEVNDSDPFCDNDKFLQSLTEEDILQVELFFRSHRAEVFVCRCLANLYFGRVHTSDGSSAGWHFSMTGVPVLVLNTGEHHRKRKLSIIISEKGTGFILWQDGVDYLTNYTVQRENFHTMQLSTDHTKLVGISFDNSGAAGEFHSSLERFKSELNDELYSGAKSKKKKTEKKPKFSAPKKKEISQPCCFVHVTKLEKPPIEGLVQPPSRLDDYSTSEQNGEFSQDAD